jgi:[acyl-carrier-protein] S-malonyltransferase
MKKVAMVFPGYGSQYVGMAKELYDQSRVMQEYFEEASNCLNMNFVKLCFASSEAELAKMNHAYVATFLVSSSLYAILKEEGIMPEVVAGYNLGEYAAIFAADGMSLPDGLYLLNKYATFYHDHLATMDVGMLRINGLQAADLQGLCDKVGDSVNVALIAVYETPVQHVVSGTRSAIERLRQIVDALDKVRVSDVDVELGLHSPMMETVAANLKMYLEKVDFKELRVPLIDDVRGKLLRHGQEIKDHVVEHIRSPLVWHKVIESLKEYDPIIEIGPGSFLNPYIQAVYPEKIVISVNKRSDIEALRELLAT